jgi:4-amino-4-deoxy-L-arabinose transferase-like glycosyltransferase
MTGEAANWHPLTWLSHMLDIQLFGANRPGLHHLVSLIFHTINSMLLFLLLFRMTGLQWRSAFVAGLFALHPFHVESVAWAAERKDVLSAFFFMLTLLAYAKYVSRVEGRGSRAAQANFPSPQPSPRGEGEPEPTVPSSVSHLPSSIFYLLALFFFALGLMSKPMLVTLPFVLLLLDYWPLNRLHLSRSNPALTGFRATAPTQTEYGLPQTVLRLILLGRRRRLRNTARRRGRWGRAGTVLGNLRRTRRTRRGSTVR